MIREPLTRGITFAATALDRAAERRDDKEWLADLETSRDARFIVLDGEGRLLSGAADDSVPFELDAEQRARIVPQLPANLLGLHGAQAWFMLRLDDAAARIEGARAIGLRTAGANFSAFHAGLAAYASGLSQWQKGSRFCPACSAPLVFTHSGHRAVCTSRTCGREHYPRTDPAVITLVEHEDACLLGRQAAWQPGRFSTLAGFVEPGEALEDAVRREVEEEAGVLVEACRYHSSQPWPFPASLMLGFTATAQAREVSLRDGELEAARWFTPAELITGIRSGTLSVPPPLSISHHLISDWLYRRERIELADVAR